MLPALTKNFDFEFDYEFTLTADSHEKIPCKAIKLSSKTLELKTGDNPKTLKATVTPITTTDKVVWSSSNSKVAKVKDGKVTPVSVGTATITAKCGEKTVKCKVTVKKGPKISSPILGKDKSLYDYCVGYGFGYVRDSADGIKLCWQGKNNTGKQINYYTVNVKYVNPVGDPAYDEITGKSTESIKYVGPVAKGESLIVYSTIGYVPLCDKVTITSIDVQYKDGTKETIKYNKSAKEFYQ